MINVQLNLMQSVPPPWSCGVARAKRPARPTASASAPRAASAPRPALATRALRPSGCIADAPPSAGAGATNTLTIKKTHYAHSHLK